MLKFLRLLTTRVSMAVDAKPVAISLLNPHHLKDYYLQIDKSYLLIDTFA